ncbi:Holliday junction recognition protein isoform 2-T2 [Discoglossus pictus]
MDRSRGSAMEAAGSSDKVIGGLSNGIIEDGMNFNLLACLDRNETIFHAKMNRIFIKYNQPFEDDITVDIQTLTYDTSEGPKPWKDCFNHEKKKPKYKKRSQTKVPETEENVDICNKTYITCVAHEDSMCHPDSSSGFLSDPSEVLRYDNVSACNKTFDISGENPNGYNSENPLVEYREDSPLVELNNMKRGEKYIADIDVLVHFNDSAYPKTCAIELTEDQCAITFSPTKNLKFQDKAGKDVICQKNLEQRSTNTTYPTRSPLKVSISAQLKSFLGRHHRSLNLDGTRCSNRPLALKESVNTEPDEHTFADDEDSDCSDAGSASFVNFYPDKIESLSRLMDIPWKKQAATNILRYYRRHVWCNNKNVLNRKRTICISKRPRIQHGLLTNVEDISTNASNMLWHNDNTNLLHTSGTSDFRGTVLGSRYSHNMSSLQTANPDQVPLSVLSRTKTNSPDKTYICKESSITKGQKNHIISDFLSNQPALPNNPSMFFRENTQISKSPLKLPSLPWQLKNDERKTKAESSPNNMERAQWPRAIERPLRRRHSFSTLPFVQSPVKNHSQYDSAFENIYRELVHQEPQKMVLPRRRILNTISHVSETVSALVNSPLSNRGKRVASDDYLSFTKFKRHKSMGDPLLPDIPSLQTDYVTNWCPPWKEPNVSPRLTGWLAVLQSQQSSTHQSNGFAEIAMEANEWNGFPASLIEIDTIWQCFGYVEVH